MRQQTPGERRPPRGYRGVQNRPQGHAERLVSTVLFSDSLVFVVSPKHRFAKRKTVSITELGMETFVAHNMVSPYRDVVLREFQRHKVALNMDVEMPTFERPIAQVPGLGANDLYPLSRADDKSWRSHRRVISASNPPSE
ncbi:MAG: LysR family transcriptional regulator substrate-binding protein [Candidatus Solibacter usitatus]|nr:LysR family transcriptional regulator substrate-binding protein [Candidatus Solibacter usitatus]